MAKPSVITGSDCPAGLEMALDPLKLRQTDRCRNVRHAVVVTYNRKPIAPIRVHTLSLEHAEARGQGVVVRGHHSPFARRDDLIAEKAESGAGSDPAHETVFVARPNGFGGIFYDEQSMFVGNLKDRIHVDRMTIEMNRHDSFCAGRDFGLDLIDVDIVSS